MHDHVLRSRLKAVGISPTQQRLRIAAALLSRPRHVSADQLLAEINLHEEPAISKATIYNTLRLFQSKGLVREVIVNPQRVFYDSTTKPHHHFYNLDSGELTDISDKDLTVAGVPTPPAGTKMVEVEVVVRVRGQNNAQ